MVACRTKQAGFQGKKTFCCAVAVVVSIQQIYYLLTLSFITWVTTVLAMLMLHQIKGILHIAGR